MVKYTGLKNLVGAAAVSLGLVSGCGSDNNETVAPPADTDAAADAGTTDVVSSETGTEAATEASTDCKKVCANDARTTAIVSDSKGKTTLVEQGTEVSLMLDGQTNVYKVTVNDDNKITLTSKSSSATVYQPGEGMVSGTVTIVVTSETEKATTPSTITVKDSKGKEVTWESDLYVPVVNSVQARDDSQDANSKGSAAVKLVLGTEVLHKVLLEGESAELKDGEDKVSVTLLKATDRGMFYSVSYNKGSDVLTGKAYYLPDENNTYHGFSGDAVKVVLNASADVISDTCRVYSYGINYDGKQYTVKANNSVVVDDKELLLTGNHVADEGNAYVTVKLGGQEYVLSQGNAVNVNGKELKQTGLVKTEEVCAPTSLLDKDTASKTASVARQLAQACQKQSVQSGAVKAARSG